MTIKELVKEFAKVDNWDKTVCFISTESGRPLKAYVAHDEVQESETEDIFILF